MTDNQREEWQKAREKVKLLVLQQNVPAREFQLGMSIAMLAFFDGLIDLHDRAIKTEAQAQVVAAALKAAQDAEPSPQHKKIEKDLFELAENVTLVLNAVRGLVNFARRLLLWLAPMIVAYVTIKTFAQEEYRMFIAWIRGHE